MDCLKFFLLIFQLFLINFAVNASNYKHHFHRVPIININGAEELIGSIREDERVVTISPQLRILPETGPICRYELTQISKNNSQIIPFESEILDHSEGTALIRLKNGATIDCSDADFLLYVTAIRCADDSAKSESVKLRISIKDINNHAPEFDAPWYSFEIDEGKVAEIARIYATDADCGHPYGKICRYEITNTLNTNPFQIDDQGILSTIRPLNRSQTVSHMLTIVAHDCGMLPSKSTLVTVHVRQRCVDGIKQREDLIHNKNNIYIPKQHATHGKPIANNLEVFFCPRENTCIISNAEAKIIMNSELNSHKYELNTAINECKWNPNTIDLMSTSSVVSSSNSNNSKSILPKDNSIFDGKTNLITVSLDKLNNNVIPERFTLGFSMKHSAGTTKQQNVKQNLLCESDEIGMNRHHFAVYLRHCKLELLLRRENEHADGEFRAAEWRWQTPEICDGDWHSYAILFHDLDNVTLFIDGNLFQSTERNPEILDDWPLHKTIQHKTRLVIGACWNGRNKTIEQYFNGELSSMFLAINNVEKPTSIECLHGNFERLRFNSIDHLIPGESVVFNKKQNQVTLKATSLKNLTNLLQKVEYFMDNSNVMKKPLLKNEKRKFSIRSQVTCAGDDKNKTIPLGLYETEIFIEKPKKLRLSISGNNLITVNRKNLKSGVIMLPVIQITTTQNIDDTEMDLTEENPISWCKVHLKPARDMDLEYFSSPAALISSLNVDFEHDKLGIMLKGEEEAKSYAQVLSKIHYYNTRSESYNKRMYTVQCGLKEANIVSNEFFVTMTITDDIENPSSASNDLNLAIEKLSSLSKKLEEPNSMDLEEYPLREKYYEPNFDQLGANRLQNILEMDLPRPKALLSHHGYDEAQSGVAGSAVAFIVVICIGFLLILLIIGVVKMKIHDDPSPKGRRGPRKSTMEGMEWDDNGMNLTINPLEQVAKTNVIDEYSDQDEQESLEDEESYREEDELTDDDDDEELDTQILPHNENSKQGLEWDDSTLNTGSKTYCV